MTLVAHFISEPFLEFGSGQKVEHPQDGLFLYGPVRGSGSPEIVQVGIIGTPDGIALVRKWLCVLIERIPVEDPGQLHTFPWPGFQAVFGARLVIEPLVTIPIPASDISNAISKTNRVDAVRSTVKIFEDAIFEHFRTDERRPDVWLVVVPEKVYAVIQVIRETTLDPSLETDRFGNPARSVQERAKIAWNFSTTLYFKGARLQPWQLADVRPGVCYVGLVFKLDPSPAYEGEACCAAQMFLNSGNGVVFRDALGPYYSAKTGNFILRTTRPRP